MFPTVEELADELEQYRDAIEEYLEDEDDECWIDVRLQVTKDGWELHNGDAQFDTDHRGWWGAGVLSTDSDVEALAEELIQEATEQWSLCNAKEP